MDVKPFCNRLSLTYFWQKHFIANGNDNDDYDVDDRQGNMNELNWG